MNTKPSNTARTTLTVARFLTFFSLAIWLGGLVFFGAIAIPAAKSFDRALIPLMVGAMLARFTFVLYVCGALLLLGWALELAARGAIHMANRKLWLAQGACSAAMLLIALYLGLVLMPPLQAAQRAANGGEVARRAMQSTTAQASTAPETRKSIVIPLLAPITGEAKARFDAQHKLYNTLTMVSLWLGLATLALLCARLSQSPPHEYSYEEQNAPTKEFASRQSSV